MAVAEGRGEPGLTRHIGVSHGVALYVSAILGAGVLVLPGQAASIAGPASLVSWGFVCVMGLPLAGMFAALARRFPEAGGVSTYVRHGLGKRLGGVCGWWFFVAGSVGQTVVPLTGGYYVVHALDLEPAWALVVAGAVLVSATASNLAGARVGGRIQLALAASVATALVVTVAAAAPRMDSDRLTPFAPHGPGSVGSAAVVLFFAFAGWETVAHLAEEFRDPERDLPAAVAWTVVVITVLYLGVAFAVVLTGTYGTPGKDRVSIGLILGAAFGPVATVLAAVAAVVISLATTTAFIAGVSRLGFSLARSGWMPTRLGTVAEGGVPKMAVLGVFAIAAGGLVLAAVFGWGTEQLVLIPSTLVVAVYLLTAAAAVRLLHGLGRFAALVSLILSAVVAPSAAQHIAVPVIVAVLALVTRQVVSGRRGPRGRDRVDRSS